ncbi:MAG: RsmD family RNA methyltransferase [Candidatus Omnitrophota bacterium]|jgi:16S rRNA (guanine(966)-N(2))-methyltransferase RsmD
MMKVTTGKFKGRNICMPKGIRPTQGKARKAIFDILGDIAGLSFLELFAGSGAVGIEAASRGAQEVVFVENNSNVLKVLSSNAAGILGTEYLPGGRQVAYYILAQSVESALARLGREKKKFDLIFLDPPYYIPKAPRSETQVAGHSGSTAAGNSEPLLKKTLQTLEGYAILAPNGLIIAQHFKKENLPDSLGVLSLFRQYRYAQTLLSLYRKKEL